MKKNETKTTSVKKSRLAEIWHQYKKNKAAVLGLIVLCAIVIIAIVSMIVLDYDTQVIAINPSNRLQPISSEHWFGTDQTGREVLYRILYGAHYSLVIGFGACAISFCVGSTLGALAGFVGGKVEDIIMRLVETFLMIPSIMLVILIVHILGASVANLILALGIATIPHFARNARAAVLSVRGCEYIEASRAIGASEFYILMTHVIPNALSTILVQATSRIAGCIIEAASFSFLGLGVPSPMPEWGSMVNDARSYMRDAPSLIIIPGLAIMILVLAINQVGDGLRDALDPKLKR